MDTKPLLYGLIGFFIGGLIVSIAATTFEKPDRPASDTSMNQMVTSLREKQGDDFDKAFLEAMIVHHEGAVEMAKLSETHAKHDEIRQLSGEVISAQATEIRQMKQWQKSWGFTVEAGHADATHH